MSTERHGQQSNEQQRQQQKEKQRQQRNYRQVAGILSTRDNDCGSIQTQNDAPSRVYQQQQQQLHTAAHTAAPRTASTTLTTTAAGAAPSILQPQALPPTATTSTTSTSTRAAPRTPQVTEQITNLLNLAQQLLSSVRHQQQLQQQRSQRRNLRLQANAPYQHLTGQALQAMQRGGNTDSSSSSGSSSSSRSNGSANNAFENTTNTITMHSANAYDNRNVNGNVAAGGNGNALSANEGGERSQTVEQREQPLCETQFCNCAECSARQLRSGVVVVRTTASADNIQSAAAVGPTRSTEWNHNSRRQFHQNNGRSNNFYNKIKQRHSSSSISTNIRASSSSRSGRDNINFQCSICLESYLLQRPMATQCGHIFCRHCIMKCVKFQGKCPMCNRKLNSSGLFRVYF